MEDKDWAAIDNDIKNAIETYNSALTSTNIDNFLQYDVNKVYIMLNELQSSVRLQDESVFLIKYKNLIEEYWT